MPHNRFISLDGIDGAGKSCQIALLADWLKQYGEVVCCRDPGGTPIGDRIREILLDSRSEMSLWTEALLYMTSRAELIEKIIRPSLAEGKLVVSDRYLTANIVYQGYAGGLPVEELRQTGVALTQGIYPGLTIILDLPTEIAMARRSGPADRVESRGIDYYEKVREGFLTEATLAPDHMKVLDASQSIGAVQEAIRREVARALGLN